MTTCRDCPPGSKRPIKTANRCATHHRAVLAQRRTASQEARRLKVYGLAAGVYDQLKAAQGGTCFICQRATGARRALAVDHDHACCNGPTSCGACVRGLLCSPCNKLLGFARDSTEFFQRAICYLQSPPAREILDGT